MADQTTVIMSSIPLCDICKSENITIPAAYDGKTKYGPWAYMCEEDFQVFGVGLGTGKGQKFVTP